MTAADAPYLIVDGPAPYPFPLTREEMTVGRLPEKDVHLDDSGVSRSHAVFSRRGSSTFLTDLGSSNGTFVNGSRLQGTIELHDGDQIKFATVQVTFHAAPTMGATSQPSSGVPAAGSPFPPTSAPVPPGPAAVIQSPPRSPGPDLGTAAPSSSGLAPASQPTGPDPGSRAGAPGPGPAPVGPVPPGGAPGPGHPPVPQAALEHAGGAPVLLTQVETRIGRVQTNDVVLSDSLVSSHHALIQQQGGQFFLIDLGSSNGTYVNGRRVYQPYPLEPGDEIRIGQADFFFRRLAPVPKKRPKGAPTMRGPDKPPPRT